MHARTCTLSSTTTCSSTSPLRRLSGRPALSSSPPPLPVGLPSPSPPSGARRLRRMRTNRPRHAGQRFSRSAHVEMQGKQNVWEHLGSSPTSHTPSSRQMPHWTPCAMMLCAPCAALASVHGHGSHITPPPSHARSACMRGVLCTHAHAGTRGPRATRGPRRPAMQAMQAMHDAASMARPPQEPRTPGQARQAL
jgi:hypothetical protein